MIKTVILQNKQLLMYKHAIICESVCMNFFLQKWHFLALRMLITFEVGYGNIQQYTHLQNEHQLRYNY